VCYSQNKKLAFIGKNDINKKQYICQVKLVSPFNSAKNFKQIKMKKILIILFFGFSNFIFSQSPESLESENSRFRKFGIGIQLFGPTAAYSIYTNLFVTKNLNLEAGIGIIGYYAGINYHKRTKFNSVSRFVGLKIGQFGFDFEPFSEIQKRIIFYAPYGFQFMNEKGYYFSFEIAIVAQAKLPTFEYYRINPYGALKIGKNF
jgi:hypothetical protein